MVHTIWIARHGNRQDFVDPEWMKTADRPYDPGLSPDGVVQAQQLAARLAREPLDAVFASPFLRSVETAHYIAEAADLPIYIEPGLSEWLNVEWFPHEPATLPLRELVLRFPRVDRSFDGLGSARYGESEGEAMQRSAEAARALADQFSGTVVLVGHGVSVAGIAAGLDSAADVPECGLCCVFKLVRSSDVWHTLICADDSHLDEQVVVSG